MIKTWEERCVEHPDHQTGMVSYAMIQARMQEEIDELRAAVFDPDWDRVKALEESLREHMAEIQRLKALAQPEQEPVAWINEHGHIDRGLDAILDPTGWTPLYAHPPQRKPLTDQEAMVLWADVYEPGHHIWILAERFARAIEKAHGIGAKHE